LAHFFDPYHLVTGRLNGPPWELSRHPVGKASSPFSGEDSITAASSYKRYEINPLDPS